MPTSDRDNGSGNGGSGNDSGNPSKKSRIDMQSMPTRQYLDQAVVPVVLQGLAAVAKER
jgi:protein dpy-30